MDQSKNHIRLQDKYNCYKPHLRAIKQLNSVAKLKASKPTTITLSEIIKLRNFDGQKRHDIAEKTFNQNLRSRINLGPIYCCCCAGGTK